MRWSAFGAMSLLFVAMGIAAGCAKPSTAQTDADSKSTRSGSEAADGDQSSAQAPAQAGGSLAGAELAQKEPAAEEPKEGDAKQGDEIVSDQQKQKEAAQKEFEEFAKPFFEELKEKLAAADKGEEVDFGPLVKKYSERLATKASAGEVGNALQVAQYLEMFAPAETVKPLYESLEKLADRIQLNNPAAAGQVRDAVKSPLARLKMLNTEPVIAGTTVGGEKFDWAKYKGKVVLLDFWATWCGPCVREIPSVKKAYEKYREKGFEVVGISIDSNKDDLTAFLDREKLPWTTIFPGDELSEKFMVEAIPATFLINREGKLVSLSARGARLEAQLEKLLEKK